MSFPRFPSYKDSGVEWLGEVPIHWGKSKLRYACKCLDGQRVPLNAAERSDRPGEIPYWGANSIQGYVDEALLDEDLVLLGEDGAPFFEPSKPVAFFSQGKVWPNNHVHVLRPTVAGTGRFITHVLNVADYAQFIDGSTRDKLTQGSMNDIPVPWPPLAEQTAIAEFLDRETGKIDELVAEQRRLMELLKEKRQAVISHAVTRGLNPAAPLKPSGIEWLGEVPAHWETRTVAKASTKITNGYVGPTRDILVEAGVPYIQATHIKGGRINFDDAYFVRPEWSSAHAKSILADGDVLIVQTGAGTGDVGLVSKNEVGFNCHALIIVAPDTSILRGPFLSAVLQSTYGQQKLASIQTGAMHPHLNCGEVKFVEIPLPPLAEQAEIVEYIHETSGRFDTLTAEAQRAIDLLQERRTALISAAVTGQIDVRGGD